MIAIVLALLTFLNTKIEGNTQECWFKSAKRLAYIVERQISLNRSDRRVQQYPRAMWRHSPRPTVPAVHHPYRKYSVNGIDLASRLSQKSQLDVPVSLSLSETVVTVVPVSPSLSVTVVPSIFCLTYKETAVASTSNTLMFSPGETQKPVTLPATFTD